MVLVTSQYGQKEPPEVFSKKGVLKNLANFTGKHLCWSHFLIKLQAYFPVKSAKFVTTHILKIICQRLLLLGVAIILTHLFPMYPFSTPESTRKPYGFLIFSGGRERVHWNKWVNKNQEYMSTHLKPILSFHSVKSVHIRSFFWSVFIPNAGKYGPEKTLYLDTFDAVFILMQ